MKRYDGYLIDLDGTLFRGDQVLPGAHSFIKELQRQQIPYLFITNNSSRTPKWIARKMTRLGFEVSPTQILTSAQATASYIAAHYEQPAVLAIGEEGLLNALKQAGCFLVNKDPKIVVVGIDRRFTYEKMTAACSAIAKGARFIGTNPDRALPTETGLAPGSGSLIAAIATATDCEPFFIGKPESPILDVAFEQLEVEPKNTLIVGDNLVTDILAGENYGVDTLLLLTGITTLEEAKASPIRPTYIRSDLYQWLSDITPKKL